MSPTATVRFCGAATITSTVLRPASTWRYMDVDQFALYNMHDAREATIDAYGAEIIPALTA